MRTHIVLLSVLFVVPSHLVVAGNLFVAESFAGDIGRIYECTPSGTCSIFASGLREPNGLAFDGKGNLFVTDSVTGSIYEFAPNGSRSTFASGLGFPRGLAFDRRGNLFETNVHSGTICEFAPNGSRTTFASGLDYPEFLTFDGSGNLFESDSLSGKIYEFAPDGTRSTFASGLNSPSGLAFDSRGNLFEADNGSGNIYEFTPDGGRSTFASGSGYCPNGLAIDGSDDLFVSGGDVVVELRPTGTRLGGFSLWPTTEGMAIAPTVPEPSAVSLISSAAIGLLACGLWRRWRQHCWPLVRESTPCSDEKTVLQEDGLTVLSLPSRWTESARRAA
jgi:sugar lactone lactonase YvrE